MRLDAACARRLLRETRVLARLARFAPRLAGTAPLGLAGPESDLDVLCESGGIAFAAAVVAAYGGRPGFRIRPPDGRRPAWRASFRHGGVRIELRAETRPVTEQRAWRHLVVEARLIARHGDGLARRVRCLRRQGLKTEPAFARCLGLRGDPYRVLLGARVRA